jgi:hypothetical protein
MKWKIFIKVDSIKNCLKSKILFHFIEQYCELSYKNTISIQILTVSEVSIFSNAYLVKISKFSKNSIFNKK